MTRNLHISLDNPVSMTITEGYIEAAYEFFQDGRVPDFYLPPSRSWYVKAAIRNRFPDRFAPSVIEVEDMLLAEGLIGKRAIAAGKVLLPSRVQWPPRTKGTVPTHFVSTDEDAYCSWAVVVLENSRGFADRTEQPFRE